MLIITDREAVPTHLPLAWTRSTLTEEAMFVEKLDLIVNMLLQPKEATKSSTSEPAATSGIEKTEEASSASLQDNNEIEKHHDVKETTKPEELDNPNKIDNENEENEDLRSVNQVSTSTVSDTKYHANGKQEDDIIETNTEEKSVIEEDANNILTKATDDHTSLTSITTSLEATKIDETSNETTVS